MNYYLRQKDTQNQLWWRQLHVMGVRCGVGKNTGTHWIGGWVGHSVGLDVVIKRKILDNKIIDKK
jgi:hypothetical protein